MFKRKKKIKEEHSYKDGDKLTKWEVNYILKNSKCPDCKIGKFLIGPSGGMSTNIKCDNCGSEINWSSGMFDERISDAKPNLSYNREEKINNILK
jgi:hypothetical protein